MWLVATILNSVIGQLWLEFVGSVLDLSCLPTVQNALGNVSWEDGETGGKDFAVQELDALGLLRITFRTGDLVIR